MEPEDENIFHSLCSNNERLLKEMNDYLRSMSITSDISIQTTSDKVNPEKEFNVGRGNEEDNDDNCRADKSYQLNSANRGENDDDDSLVAMALHMDAASIVSDPLEACHHANFSRSPRLEISAGMEEMLAQFTKNNEPFIKERNVNDRFNHSDPSITRVSLHSKQHAPPYIRMSTHSPTMRKSKIINEQPSLDANILPFPNFTNTYGRRRLSIERISVNDTRDITASSQQGRKLASPKNKCSDLPRERKDEIISRRDSISLKASKNTSSARRKGWHRNKHTSLDNESDDEMRGVGINTRVQVEKLKHKHTSKDNSQEKRQQKHTERRSKSSQQSCGKSNSRKQRSEQSSRSLKNNRHRHRRTKTSHSCDKIQSLVSHNRANSSSPKIFRKALGERSDDSDGDNNHSAYDSDNETQFFYESTDDDGSENEDFDSGDKLTAVGTSVVDAVIELNERSAVAKVKNLFKLNI